MPSKNAADEPTCLEFYLRSIDPIIESLFHTTLQVPTLLKLECEEGPPLLVQVVSARAIYRGLHPNDAHLPAPYSSRPDFLFEGFAIASGNPPTHVPVTLKFETNPVGTGGTVFVQRMSQRRLASRGHIDKPPNR